MICVDLQPHHQYVTIWPISARPKAGRDDCSVIVRSSAQADEECTAAILTTPFSAWAASIQAGASCLQWPHQGAKNSTNTLHTPKMNREVEELNAHSVVLHDLLLEVLRVEQEHAIVSAVQRRAALQQCEDEEDELHVFSVTTDDVDKDKRSNLVKTEVFARDSTSNSSHGLKQPRARFSGTSAGLRLGQCCICANGPRLHSRAIPPLQYPLERQSGHIVRRTSSGSKGMWVLECFVS